MRIREFECELWLPRAREEVFRFFSDANNLNVITPDWLHFRTITSPPIVLRAGTVIDYRLRVRGVPVRWRTEIKIWDPPHRFVDEQTQGPYRLWVHEHLFETRDGGTLAKDRVRYAVPFDLFTHKLLVRPDIERIFAFRRRQLSAQFAAEPSDADNALWS